MSLFDLTGKVAVITGSSRGIGRAIAEHMAYHGAKVSIPTIDGSVTMKIPARTQSGNVVRLRGKGVVKKGAPVGDLYVHFLVQIPKDGGVEVGQLVDGIAKFQTDDPRQDIHL